MRLNAKKRMFLLLLIITFIVLIVEFTTIYVLYSTALEEEADRLVEMAKSQARLIEAIARFDKEYSDDYPKKSRAATLSQIRDAHSKYRGFGETGEFTLSTRKGDDIVFLLSHRHYDLDNPKPVPWNSNLAEPMRQALSGRSGTIIGLDYRGETVLAAYEPVDVLDLGIVAKIDLSEVREPFIIAIYRSLSVAVVAIIGGALIFFRITNPIIDELNATIAKLEKALKEVKTLRGIVPICSYCKKIRNDQGFWDKVEVYVRDHTEANFSHGVCPECLEKYFPKSASKRKIEMDLADKETPRQDDELLVAHATQASQPSD